MARIRTIKPEFFTNSKITKLAPLARLFYVSLWCEADRLGRLKWDPDTLKDRYLPRDKCDVDQIGTDLAKAKLVRFYEVAGVTYIDVPGFLEHQVINNRESDSSLPAFTDDACVTRESGVRDAACGKEGRKGREGKEGTSPIVPKGDEHTPEFLELMQVYPSRGDARNPIPLAWKAWLKALERGGDPRAIIDAAKRYARSEAAGTKFIAQTATWLNQDDWKVQPLPVAEQIAPGDSQWKMRLEGWTRSKFWKEDLWGPPPDQPGCKAPKGLLPTTSRPPEDYLRA